MQKPKVLITNKPVIRIYVNFVCALFILLFVYTGLSKLRSHSLFLHTLRIFLAARRLATFLSWMIPTIELLISITLYIPRWQKTGLLLSTGIMCVFTLYLGYVLVFNRTLPCSCGGIISELSWNQHLL